MIRSPFARSRADAFLRKFIGRRISGPSPPRRHFAADGRHSSCSRHARSEPRSTRKAVAALPTPSCRSRCPICSQPTSAAARARQERCRDDWSTFGCCTKTSRQSEEPGVMAAHQIGHAATKQRSAVTETHGPVGECRQCSAQAKKAAMNEEADKRTWPTPCLVTSSSMYVGLYVSDAGSTSTDQPCGSARSSIRSVGDGPRRRICQRQRPRMRGTYAGDGADDVGVGAELGAAVRERAVQCAAPRRAPCAAFGCVSVSRTRRPNGG